MVTMKYLAFALSVLHSTTAETQNRHLRNLSENRCDEEYCSKGSRCHKLRCAGCEFTCSGQCNFDAVTTCNNWCEEEDCDNSHCSGCQFCANTPASKCPLATFTDITESMFSVDPSYWYQPVHSGMPYKHQGSPLFVDLNGDGFLDYFNSMHGHRIVNEDDTLDDRMELALTTPSPNDDGELVLKSIADRIIFEDDPDDFRQDRGFSWIDPHGQNLLDLDGDGILDLYIAQGGNHGRPLVNPSMLDSFLFFGELDSTGQVVFRGGRTQAVASGLSHRSGRGRFNYMMDVNGDGLIDIFAVQSRRKDNIVSASVLLINQGDRTWTEDKSMMEYPTTMILTDADGDGIANEIMIIRGFCFPERDGPGVDPAYPEYGKYSDEVRKFCSSRPVGTTAIYKFNQTNQAMEEISTTYRDFKPGNKLQPPCCPHGSFDGNNGCSAISMISADLDNDMIADQIVLYIDKIVFYFSSDRPDDVLPIGRKYQGLVLDLPKYCKGENVRVLDLNNDGDINIIVMCSQPGAIAIYTQGSEEKQWDLQENCSGNNALGDINDRSLAFPDLHQLFDNEDCRKQEFKQMKRICKKFKETGSSSRSGAPGLTLVDLNNDGFTDAVVSHSFGYLRFFYNTPSELDRRNRYITFKLKGNGIDNNVYGIGATLILTTVHNDGRERRQFREVSYHQHTSDSGYQDDRITFGLGIDYTPIKLAVMWPNGYRQVSFLSQWEFTGSLKPLEILDKSENQSDIGDSMCLSSGAGKEWLSVFLVKCSSSTHEHYKIDENGRMRNGRFKNYCLALDGERASNFVTIKLKHCSQVFDSWLRTSDDRFTLSGSDKGISVANAESGEEPFLSPPNSSYNQKWKMNPLEILDKSEIQSDIGDSMCLSSGAGKEWLSVFLVKCSSSTHEHYKIDENGRMRNGRFKNYCLALDGEKASNFIRIKLKHCSQVFDSWLRTADDRFTLSGSDKGISVANAESGEEPFLSPPNSSYIQKWKMNPV